MHQWHWISAAISLAGLMLFSITGLTLNNAALFEGNPVTTRQDIALPPEIHTGLQAWLNPDTPEASRGPARLTGAPSTTQTTVTTLPVALETWLDQALGIHISGRPAEVSTDEIYISLPEPGGDAWLAIDMATGELEYERIHRGVVAYLNDLHKGRHSGSAWSWFIDLIAIACVVFAVTGLFLLKIHGKNRPMTWPLTGAGIVVPAAIMLFLVH